jgi:hypothetical protein
MAEEVRTSSSIAPTAPRSTSLSDLGAKQLSDGSWALTADQLKVAQQAGLVSFDNGQFAAGGKPIYGINPDGSLVAPRTNDATLLDPGQARNAIEQVKTASEKANLVKMITGKDAPGFNNNQINRIIDKTLGGDGTTFGGVTNPDTVVGPGGSGAGGSGPATGAGVVPAGLYQQFIGAYNNPTVGTAPQASASLASAVQAQGSVPISASQAQGSAAVQAQQAQIAAALSAAQSRGSAPVSTVNMSPAQIAAYVAAQKGGPIAYGSVTGGHSAAAVAAPSVKADSATFNSADEMAARAQQQGLVTGLQGAIAGTDPSVAAILLRQATDRNIANQYALAASSHGIGSGLAERQAMMGAADLNSKAAADNAILRAKEITDARAQLADVLGQQRTADISTATTQFTAAQGVNSDYAGAQNTRGNLNATLANATGIANASNDTNAAVATARNLTDANTTAASLANAVEIDNANNRVSLSEKQADLTQDASKTNAGAANETNRFNATQDQQNQQFNVGQTNDIGKFNTGETNKANQFNAGQANTVNLANASQYQQNNQFNTGQANDVSKFNSTQNQQNNQFNAGQTNDISKTNANNQTGISQSNTTARLTQAQIDAKARQDAAANALAASGQSITQENNTQTNALGWAKAKQDQDNADNQLIVGGAKALSDRRAKTDIKPSDKEIAELLAKLKGFSYRYKDPSAPGAGEGERFGPMAQDLERSKAGKAMVRDTPDGKMVDMNQAVMTALAALAHVDKRISKIERRA